MKFGNVSKYFKRQKTENFLLSPLFLALIISAVIVLAIPSIKKYKLEVVRKYKIIKSGGVSFYEDLDSDGKSEYLVSFSNGIGEHSLRITTHDNRLIDTWNFYKLYPPRSISFPVYSGDYNDDGFKEIYAISWINDSIFLDIVTPLKKNGIKRKNIFLDTLASYNQSADFRANMDQLKDVNNDGFKELLLSLSAGYSLHPRRAYMYDIKNDNLSISPLSGVTLIKFKIIDIDNDGTYEILGSTSTTGNIKPEMNIPYPDSSSWLMVLNDQLEFKFKPIEFPVYPSSISTRPIIVEEDTLIFACFKNTGVMPVEQQLMLVSPDGEIIKKQKLESDKISYPSLLEAFCNINDPVYIHDEEDNEIYEVNPDLSLKYKTRLGMIIKNLEINKDSKPVNIVIDHESYTLVIADEDFKNTVSMDIVSNELEPFNISVIKKKRKANQLYMQCGSQCFILDYYINPWYRFSFIIYFVIFLAIWFFIFIIRRLYRNQLLKQHAIAHKISELQLNSVNNQINPHFIFNAMNSITSAIYKENKEEAYSFGTKFSNLMREALMSSDKISRSLEKEIEFVSNYLELEKFRFKGTFDYTIKIDQKVNMLAEVPKMIIQTFAENAVKHGLRQKEKDGLIEVIVKMGANELIIEIKDNGIGRGEANKKKTSGTGKGLKIMDQVLELYKDLKGVTIAYKIEDLSSGGMGVLIRIPGEIA